MHTPRHLLLATPSPFTSLLAVIGCLALPGTTLAAPQIQDIGAPAGAYSNIRDVSQNGTTAVGGLRVAGGPMRVFAWTEARGVQILDDTGVSWTTAAHVSADGLWAAGFTQTAPLAPTQAAIWNTVTGARTDLGFVPGGADMSFAYFVTDGGNAVFGIADDGNDRRQPYRWTPSTGYQLLGTLGMPDTWIGAVSLDGNVVVGYGTNLQRVRIPSIWTPTTGLQPIPGLPAENGYARHISNDGRFVLGDSGAEDFYYDRTTGTMLFLSSAGFSSSVGPLDMSGDGQTLLLREYSAVAGPATFLWRPATGAITPISQSSQFSWRNINNDGTVVAGLRTTLPTPTPARWTLAGGIEVLPTLGGLFHDAGEVNGDGSVIFGYSNLPDGTTRSVIWPTSSDLGANYCGPGTPNSTGAPGQISLSGTNLLAGGLAELQASNLPVGATALFLASPTPGFTFPVTGSQGALCLGGSIGRFVGPGQVQTVSASGEIALTFNASQIPSPLGPITPSFGESWYFQAWHRDTTAGGAATSNFTDGATVRFY